MDRDHNQLRTIKMTPTYKKETHNNDKEKRLPNKDKLRSFSISGTTTSCVFFAFDYWSLSKRLHLSLFYYYKKNLQVSFLIKEHIMPNYECM